MKTGRVVSGGVSHMVSVQADGSLLTATGEVLDSERVQWLAPAHGMVICAALNYRTHLAQLNARFQEAPYAKPPQNPVLFVKPENTLTGHCRAVQVPDGVPAIQPGPALALVIGRMAQGVKADEAMAFIKGYTLFNDFSLPEESFFRPPVRDKCFDSAGPLGPLVVSVDEAPDPTDLEVRLFLNGELKQSGRTSDLVWSIPSLMESITGFMTLREDDILVTGFPAGRVDAVVGDSVEVEVEGVGRLESRLVSEREYYEGREAA